MRLKELTIRNFRSINDMQIACESLVSVIGQNNHGKSNVLAAIEFLLSRTSKPDPKDFFNAGGKAEKELWVEALFDDLTDQEKTTFHKYLINDTQVRIRKTGHFDDLSVHYNGFLIKEDSIILEEGPLLGAKNVAAGVLPEYIRIPAVKDLSEELRVKGTTSFGRLVSAALREMAERDPGFAEAREKLQAAIQQLNAREHGEAAGNPLAELEAEVTKILSGWGASVRIQVQPPEIERLFELGAQVHVDDGVETIADRKGHGLQRAILFAFLRAWAEVTRATKASQSSRASVPRKASDSIVFAIEEPELYLHPQAQRMLFRDLRDLSKVEGHQIFLTTHSPQFIDIEEYRSIVIIEKRNPIMGSTAKQCLETLFEDSDPKGRKARFKLATWINPDRAELFFAKRVVLVEGDTEKAVIPYIADRLGIFDYSISIVNCGSKFNLPLYINLLNAFRIPYIVLYDEDTPPDPIPESWSEDKKKEAINAYIFNETIEAAVDRSIGYADKFCPNIDNAIGVSKSSGEKLGKPLAAIEFLARTDNIPETIQRIVRICYDSPAPEKQREDNGSPASGV